MCKFRKISNQWLWDFENILAIENRSRKWLLSVTNFNMTIWWIVSASDNKKVFNIHVNYLCVFWHISVSERCLFPTNDVLKLENLIYSTQCFVVAVAGKWVPSKFISLDNEILFLDKNTRGTHIRYLRSVLKVFECFPPPRFTYLYIHLSISPYTF